MARATLRSIALWLAAVAVAVAVSSAAVTLATDSVTTDPPVDLASPGTTTPGARPAPSGDDGHDGTAAGATAERSTTAIGGTARFRRRGGDVSVVFASPATGFRVDVDDEGSEVRVVFRSEDHESRIDADLEDGALRVRVREDAEE